MFHGLSHIVESKIGWERLTTPPLKKRVAERDERSDGSGIPVKLREVIKDIFGLGKV
jgi:hypothetical protein